jgi:glycosyltransferase involved in cell wall biosynthesis
MHVAIVCEYPTVLGGERSMLAVTPRLRAAGVRFHAIVPKGKLADAWATAGVEVVPWTAGRDSTPAKSSSAAAEELRALLVDLRPQVVHANSLAMGRLVGPLASGLGIASIAHLRDIVRQSRSAIEQLNQNARLLAVSDAVRRFHVAAGLAAEKVRVLHNGVDLTEFHPRPATGRLHRELGLRADMQLVGAIGQISLRKGWDVLLDAAERVIAQSENVVFVLVGACYSDKPETRDVERQVRAAAERFPGRVHWLGERDDVADLLPELSILAHAARQEPLGRVLLEAAATGIAVVATDVGGTSEIFPPSANAARLVTPNDPDALAKVLLELLADRPQRLALGSAARQRAAQTFDVEQSAKSLLRHYQEVAELA